MTSKLASLKHTDGSESQGEESGVSEHGSQKDHETVEIPASTTPSKVSVQRNHFVSFKKPEEADLFRALSGTDSAKIPEADLQRLGWSDARIKAFRNREKNPNHYYYRFNNPGEPQATGKWSAKEKSLFFQLIEKGVDYQVGEAKDSRVSGASFR